jgi:H+/gluconate symporter-like permease
MCIEPIVRLVAGSLVLSSLLLVHFVSPWFWLLTAFVGLNLFQSSLTKWCLLEQILRALHVPACGDELESKPMRPAHGHS